MFLVWLGCALFRWGTVGDNSQLTVEVSIFFDVETEEMKLACL